MSDPRKAHTRWWKIGAYVAVGLFVFSLLSVVALPFIATTLFLNQRFERVQHDSLDYGIKSERTVLTTSDNLNLAAWRTFASDDDAHTTLSTAPRGTVIILSGIQDPSVTAFFGYSKMLAEHGWDALLIEKRARSLSEGQSIGLGFTEWKDVQAGVEYLSRDARAAHLPIVAMGTSAGAATVLIAGAELPRIDGIISISAYSDFICAYVDVLSRLGVPRVIGDASRPIMQWNLARHFGEGEIKRTPLNAMDNLTARPVLLMQSTEDWQVTYTQFENLRDKAEYADVDLSIFVREGDWHFVVYSHLFATPAHDQEFTHAIVEFLDQF